MVFVTKLRQLLVRARAVGATAAALSALFLVPVPALAIYFLTPWKIISNVQTGGAPRAQVAAYDSQGRHGMTSALQVNMGSFRSNTRATSSVVIEREFRIDSPAGERFAFRGLLGGMFRNTSARANAVIGHYVNGQLVVDESIPLLRTRAGGAAVNSSLDWTFLTRRLAADGGQPYYLMVSVEYSKHRGGFWHDRARGGSASFHRFERVRG